MSEHNSPFPPPTPMPHPAPPTHHDGSTGTAPRPWWQRKRFLVPAAVVGVLAIVGTVAPPPAESEGSDRGAQAAIDDATAPTVEPDLGPAVATTEPAGPADPIDTAPADAGPVDTGPADAAPTPTVATPDVSPDVSSGSPVEIAHVVDGDTVDLASGERIRILGYDAPEQGECGGRDATDALAFILTGGPITMDADIGDDTDRYGRLLRHILVAGTPVGLTMIDNGYADARYDSLDGYARHRFQDQYRAADGPNRFACPSAPDTTAAPARPAIPAPPAAVVPIQPAIPAPSPANNGPFANCDAVRAAGRAPILRGEPGFEQKFDRDNDGIGCE